MTHDTNPTPEPSALPGRSAETGKQENWDRDEMRPDFGDDSNDAEVDEEQEAPTWNENQMARERPDGTRSPGLPDEEIEESRGGLSGGGANPGGGERWAERDKK
jgi:hypothetical protein